MDIKRDLPKITAILNRMKESNTGFISVRVFCEQTWHEDTTLADYYSDFLLKHDLAYSNNQGDLKIKQGGIDIKQKELTNLIRYGSRVKDKSNKWYTKVLNEFIKNTVQYAVTFGFAFIIGLATGKSCNQSGTQSNSPQDIPKVAPPTLQKNPT